MLDFQVYSASRVPELFVDKLVAFHFGHLSLTVDDLTSYFVHLDKTLAKFAYHVKEFRDLSENDRSALLMANAPQYFQLHMCRYVLVFVSPPAADCPRAGEIKVFIGRVLRLWRNRRFDSLL